MSAALDATYMFDETTKRLGTHLIINQEIFKASTFACGKWKVLIS